MAALSISSVLISYILITQPLVYCLRKKCKIYYSLYCTTTCIISRDEITSVTPLTHSETLAGSQSDINIAQFYSTRD
jgi:hypothetical protein